MGQVLISKSSSEIGGYSCSYNYLWSKLDVFHWSNYLVKLGVGFFQVSVTGGEDFGITCMWKISECKTTTEEVHTQ